ncbi:MAG: beta-ketoacyl-[acyl-carrier-protein] synthase II [Fibrobacter sp.]|jgi:3-oxoacyl-[acyl-carrier-protein] synthase-1|nr:beta-ketoacyl-[acyl-carrier-protein] synthase II [Fibrobacter sp.]
MNCKIDSYILANALGTSTTDIFANLETAKDKTYLTESDEYFSDRKVFIGKTDIDLPVYDKQKYSVTVKNDMFPVWAYLQLRDRVDFLKKKFGANRIGMVFGTSTSGIYNLENAVHNKKNGSFPPDFHYKFSENAYFANYLKNAFGITGPAYTVSTSCTSGVKALSSAKTMLDCGFCDAVITGGIDTLCQLTVKGFDSLELLSNGIANPMSANRDGINIGEGIAICILTREVGGVQIKGIGESCDTYHVSSPDPEGTGALRSMIMAMENARLLKENVDYIQLHGTGTNLNDISEAKAIFNIWGDSIACSSLKPLIGHTLGISGIMGVLICALILEQDQDRVFLPKHIWDGCRDENIPPIRLLDCNTPAANCRSLNFLVNNFAFGGNNCSVIVGKDYL